MIIKWKLARCYQLDVDPELFFQEATEERAVAICESVCPIKAECLQWALDRPERFGVWGGMTEKQRVNLSFTRERVKCPGCGNRDTGELIGLKNVEICYGCGLSWRV